MLVVRCRDIPVSEVGSRQSTGPSAAWSYVLERAWERPVVFLCLVCCADSRSEAVSAPAALLRASASAGRARGAGCRTCQARAGCEVGEGVTGRDCAGALQEPRN